MSEYIGKFAAEFNRLIDTHERRFSTNQLAGEFGLTYEFVRKLRRGDNLPSPTLILISNLFGAELLELEEWVKQSKLAKEYGGVIAEILSDPVRMACMKSLGLLDEPDQEEILRLIEEALGTLQGYHFERPVFKQIVRWYTS
jgi:hypothetical protein